MKIFALAALISMTALFCSCSRSENRTPEEAGTSFIGKCQSRLERKKGLTSAQSQKFCTCFLVEAGKKVTPYELDIKMDGGADDAFKGALEPELKVCLDQLNNRP